MIIKLPVISVERIGLFLKVVSLWIVAVILVILSTPIFVLRIFIGKIGVKFRKDLGKMLNSSATLLNQKRMNIVTTFYVEGELDVNFMRDFFMRKVILLQNPDGELKYPELQQFVQSWCGFYFWKWDKEFDIQNHIGIYDASQHETHEELMKHLECTPFPQRQSAWNFLLLENQHSLPEYIKNDDGPISVVIFHTSHSMFDCFSLFNLMLFETMAEQHLQCFRYNEPKKFKYLIRLLKSVPLLWKRSSMYYSDKNRFYDRNSVHLKNMDGNYEPEYRISTTPKTIPLNLVRDIRNRHNVCTTTIILSCTTAGIRGIMKRKNIEIPKTIRLFQHYPRKYHPEKLRNHFYMTEVNLPVGTEDYAERLASIQREVNKCKKEIIQPSLQIMQQILGLMPHFVVRKFCRMKIATVLLSNFAIPGELTLFGHNVLHCHFVNGISDGDTPILVSSLGYGEHLQMNVQISEEFVKKDEENEIFDYIYQELEILKNSSNRVLTPMEV